MNFPPPETGFDYLWTFTRAGRIVLRATARPVTHREKQAFSAAKTLSENDD
jgi:hypothetical protein